MGTSRNDRSPDIPPWKPALAILGRRDIPQERQLSEVWRAAQADRGARLLDAFSHPLLLEACRLVAERAPLRQTLDRFDEARQRGNYAGLAVELCSRALARSAARAEGAIGFVGELFGEATAYYLSRDLPSFVASENRVATNSEAIQLKRSLTKAASLIAQGQGEPPLDREAWAQHVQRVLHGLTVAK